MALRLSATVKLNLNSAELTSRVSDALVAATKETFEEIGSTARERAPVLDKATSERYSGELRDSVHVTVRRVKAGVKAKVFVDFYGAFVELGTAKMRAEPFLWPSLEAHIAELPESLKEKLSEGRR